MSKKLKLTYEGMTFIGFRTEDGNTGCRHCCLRDPYFKDACSVLNKNSDSLCEINGFTMKAGYLDLAFRPFDDVARAWIVARMLLK